MSNKELTIGKLIEILQMCNQNLPIAVLANNHWNTSKNGLRVSLVKTPTEPHIIITAI